MYRRFLTHSIREALEDTPVNILIGARQTGKSTLCHQLQEEQIFPAQMVSLDDQATLAAVQTDPLGFLENLNKHLIIDEIQRGPELFVSIKKLVDQEREERRILLTGSANVFTLPKVSESLAGRLEIHRLWPLSQDEIIGARSTFLDQLWSNQDFSSVKTNWSEIVQAMEIGGYPECLKRKRASRRNKWLESYISSILQKDIKDLSNIEGLTQIPNLLHLIGSRVGSNVNISELSRLSGIKNSTLQRYLAILENVFIILRIPAWTPNIEGPFVKSPKIYLNDTGLLCYLRGEDHESLTNNRIQAGAFFENFVVMELIKQISWSDTFSKIYHFSMHKGAEVDVVMEDRKKNVYGIEIKAASTLTKDDFKGLRRLSELSPQFKKGIVLYTGDEYLPFGDKFYAVPMSALWNPESHNE